MVRTYAGAAAYAALSRYARRARFSSLLVAAFFALLQRVCAPLVPRQQHNGHAQFS
jgi:hypothetical protein